MKKVLIFIIVIYQKTLSKILVVLFGKGCRFNPTCSEYAKTAIDRFGVIEGLNLSLKRIIRCHPFSGQATFDPVPEMQQ